VEHFSHYSERAEVSQANADVVSRSSDDALEFSSQCLLEMYQEWVYCQNKKSGGHRAPLQYPCGNRVQKGFPERVHMVCVIPRIQGANVIDKPGWSFGSFKDDENPRMSYRRESCSKVEKS